MLFELYISFLATVYVGLYAIDVLYSIGKDNEQSDESEEEEENEHVMSESVKRMFS